MTSALERLQANEDDTIWRQNASVIRRLYQEEKKTLKEVKAIMENENGFPMTPLSVWEIKLRGLGMQKKLKARDWSLVYQHVRPRLQHGGKKQLRKPTAILINDTVKPWDDCWKEFRRNKALNQRPHEGALPPLPSGIVIRTPSPVLIDTAGSTQQHMSAQFRILQMIQTAVVSFQPLLDWDSQSNIETSGVLRYSGSVYRLCLEGIPLTRMFEKISDYRDGVSPSVRRGQEDRDDPITSAVCLSYNQTSRGHATLWASQLTGLIAQSMPRSALTAPTDQSLGRNFDSYHYLSMVIYLLSNNYVDIPRTTDKELKTNVDIEQEEDFAEILEMTFELVSSEVLFALLHARLPSIKAAWQKLLLGAGFLRNKEAFKLLICAGMDNDWLDETSRGHSYLYHSVQNDCADIINALLKRGCRAHSSFDLWEHKSAITAALDNGNLNYAMLLIQHCDFDPLNTQLPGSLATNFLEFIVNFDDTNHDHHCCLNFFLEQGADVDYEIDFYSLRSILHWGCPAIINLSESWPLSILDFVFYFHRPLFPKLAVFSKVPPRKFSRVRALLCIEEGVHVIREYLKFDQAVARPRDQGNDIAMDSSELSTERKHCLEILLAEQFLLKRYENHRKFCWSTMQGFLELGINLAWLSQDKELAPAILHATACLITSGDGADKEHGLQILQWLLNQGFEVQESALVCAVKNHGVAMLECLARSCSDLKKHGVSALVEAILRNNFEATKLLLDGGVDVNSIVRGFAGPDSMVARAARGSTFAMMKYLVQRGAEPRSCEQHGHPSDFLVKIFRFTWGDEADLFIKVKYIIEEYVPITEPSCPSSYLLEMCLQSENDPCGRWPIFEYLLKKGAKLRPGSPLAEWIGSGGRHQLVREMLDSGADANAYSFQTARASFLDYSRPRTPLQAAASIGDYTLVCLLLARGADVNQPALGGAGMTALQAICTWDPIRSEERIRKDKIINLFLENGADVNAANSTGHTALHFAAALGDLSTAFALLKHGAKLDAMSAECCDGMYQKTALDAAACEGRLDMVNFLLNANALSWTAFSDGGDYDGAIEWAIQEGHFVVSEMIRKHSADRKRWDVRHGQAVDTGVPTEHIPQAPLLRAKSGTASWPQNERRLTPSENFQGVAVLDQTSGISYALDNGTVESSTAASKADGESMLGAEATDVSWARVIGEIDDEAPLADTGGDNPSGGKGDGTATQAFDTRQASSTPRGRLHQTREQNWVEDEQQNVDPLQISSGLGTDVFMGFSECSSA